jgi:hypothetical protein
LFRSLIMFFKESPWRRSVHFFLFISPWNQEGKHTKKWPLYTFPLEYLQWKLYRFFSRFTSHMYVPNISKERHDTKLSPLFFIKHSPDIPPDFLSFAVALYLLLLTLSNVTWANMREHTFKCGREDDFSSTSYFSLFPYLTTTPKNEWFSFSVEFCVSFCMMMISRRSHYRITFTEKALSFLIHLIVYIHKQNIEKSHGIICELFLLNASDVWNPEIHLFCLIKGWDCRRKEKLKDEICGLFCRRSLVDSRVCTKVTCRDIFISPPFRVEFTPISLQIVITSRAQFQ